MIEKEDNSPQNAAYQVKLETFEGPLDLLLHLVGKAELDITEISLAKITDEYFEYIKLMQNLNLEMESSFLVILATLLEIKSKVLLPAEEKELESYPFEGDSEFELVKRLKEYKIFKEAALDLSNLERNASLSYTRGIDVNPEERVYPYVELSFFDLVGAFKEFLEKRKEILKKDLKIEKVKVTISEKIKEIYEIVLSRKKVNFFDLLGENCSKSEIIIYFLALLELMRIGKIFAFQDNTSKDIILTKKKA